MNQDARLWLYSHIEVRTFFPVEQDYYALGWLLTTHLITSWWP